MNTYTHTHTHTHTHKTARNPNSNPNVNQGLLMSYSEEKGKKNVLMYCVALVLPIDFNAVLSSVFQVYVASLCHSLQRIH